MYGTTQAGGVNHYGTIFKFSIPSPAGISNTKKATSNIKIYPNPSNGKFTIHSSGGGQLTVEVYNTLGANIYSTSGNGQSTFSMDLGNQPAGIYLYRILTETGSLVNQGKLIIQK
jgi:hypothetical protein